MTRTPEPAVVSFDITPVEAALLGRILDRADEVYAEFGVELDRLTLSMDLAAANANGCPLDFARLLDFPRFDFVHDVAGIPKYIDRGTGQLLGFFVPRCARRQP